MYWCDALWFLPDDNLTSDTSNRRVWLRSDAKEELSLTDEGCGCLRFESVLLLQVVLAAWRSIALVCIGVMRCGSFRMTT